MHTFTYDYEGKMQLAVSIADPNNMVEYKYDPMGNRIGRVEYDAYGIASEQKYVLDYTGSVPKVLLELDKVAGQWVVSQKNYYYGNRLVMSTDGNDSNRRYYIHDRLGSVRCVVDANALSVQNNYTYTPYGEDIASQTSEAVENDVRFAGYNHDDELGQYYVWARMYSPYMARFNGYDPVLGDYKEPLALHQYLYCWNDPINNYDPSGRVLIDSTTATAQMIVLSAMAATVATQMGCSLKGNLIQSVYTHTLSTIVGFELALMEPMAKSKNKVPKQIRNFWETLDSVDNANDYNKNNGNPNGNWDPNWGKRMGIGLTIVTTILSLGDTAVDIYQAFLDWVLPVPQASPNPYDTEVPELRQNPNPMP